MLNIRYVNIDKTWKTLTNWLLVASEKWKMSERWVNDIENETTSHAI